MIEGFCFTNIDKYKEERWPREFVVLPRRGDRVEAKSGRTLRVADITHTVISVRDYNLGDDHSTPIITKKPYVKIELHRR